ncbi:hypothetical protein Pstr01_18290 [Pseudomonas straminea]|nr:hypothetical protein Pstr01_18290 [Pseudomonas straminea]
MGGNLAQSGLARQYASIQPGLLQASLQIGCRYGIGYNGETRPVNDAKRLQLGQPRESGQGKSLVTRRMAGDDIEGAETD